MLKYTFIDGVNHVNYKSKDLKDPKNDYQFSDHHYSVVRHEVVRKPEMNGMATIKVRIYVYMYVCIQISYNLANIV